MNQPLQDHLDQMAAALQGAARPHWVRIVVWIGRLLEKGETSGFTYPNRVVTYDGSELGADYITSGAALARVDAQALDALTVGQPEAGWTILRFELDRDGAQRADFSHEPARELEDSANDEFWDGVHDYVTLNHDELERFVSRLREQGDLPDPATTPSGPDPMSLPPSQRPGAAGAAGTEARGRLGRLFGRG